MSTIFNKKFFFTAVSFLAIFAVAIIFFRSFIPWDSPSPDNGIAPDLPLKFSYPGFTLPQAENTTDATGLDCTVREGYTLYDNFNRERSDVWTKPFYKPTSAFIDTTFLPSYVEFLNGDLVLRSNVNEHRGSEYKTKQQFLYGKYRASIRTTQTPGTFLAFFLYTPDPDNHNEIDIEFTKSDGASKVRLTTWVQMEKNEHTYALAFDPSQDYHVYGFDWHPDHVDFYIDDLEHPLWTSTDMVPQGACYLYFNNWVVKDVPQDHGDGANAMYVDWVTVQPLDGQSTAAAAAAA